MTNDGIRSSSWNWERFCAKQNRKGKRKSNQRHFLSFKPKNQRKKKQNSLTIQKKELIPKGFNITFLFSVKSYLHYFVFLFFFVVSFPCFSFRFGFSFFLFSLFRRARKMKEFPDYLGRMTGNLFTKLFSLFDFRFFFPSFFTFWKILYKTIDKKRIKTLSKREKQSLLKNMKTKQKRLKEITQNGKIQKGTFPN